MAKVLLNFVCILLWFVICGNAYKVANVEYHRKFVGNLEEVINANLENYLSLIDKTMLAHKDLDIMVFPEDSLVISTIGYTKDELLQYSTIIPDDNNTIPCLEPAEATVYYVKALSCASRKHKIYISANARSKNSQNEIFNTNIVFDREGRIVSVYRKIRPYGYEKYVTPGKDVEYFKTDFGVTFGVFICFDMLYEDTFKELLDKVDAFIHPSYWQSTLPQLVSIEMQQAWSYLHETVLISSGANYMPFGAGGSGIYSGRHNVYITYLSSQEVDKVLIADIKKGHHPKYDATKQIRDVNNFNFAPIVGMRPHYSLSHEKPNTNIHKTVCDGSFCCEFKLNVNDTTGLVLRIVNAPVPIKDDIVLGFQNCMLLQCNDDDTCSSVPERHNFNKQFKHMEVKINNATKDVDYYPNLISRNIQFIPTEKYTFDEENLHLIVKKPVENIYVFGYFGRNYKEDIWNH